MNQLNPNSLPAMIDALIFVYPLILFEILLSLLLAFCYRGVSYTAPGTDVSVEVAIVRRAFIFMMAGIFGGVIGAFMGSSQSATGAAIINIVVPIISGYIAYITSKDLAPEIKIFVPGVVVALLLSLIVSFWQMRFYFV
jgi:hypothetical protein